MIDWFGLSVIIMDLLAAIGLVVAIIRDNRLRTLPNWHRLGICVIAAGLIGQAARSYVAITTGVAPRDSEMPYWVLKDVGVFILAISFVWVTFFQKSRPCLHIK